MLIYSAGQKLINKIQFSKNGKCSKIVFTSDLTKRPQKNIADPDQTAALSELSLFATCISSNNL